MMSHCGLFSLAKQTRAYTNVPACTYMHPLHGSLAVCVPVSPRWRSTRRLAATLPGVTVSGKSANLTWLISFYGNIYGNAPPGLAAGSAVMRTSGARNIGPFERRV